MSFTEQDYSLAEIKIAMIRYGTSQAEVARTCEVSAAHVHRVILGKSTSDRVQRAIATAIKLDVSEVFPTRYPAYGRGPRVESIKHCAAS
ncbi:helix-turn-helix domain-containing protein [uncultured Desulfuromonas sp.]|uniref:helix-turn-helix domain-containing protein n=1 Tax=uncultured Desulfuromonas sp. TaxID=181013 RepID=UPI002AAAA542|nr:helix-turn-helix domain-containing protein [uncultured Desulfuromonas sp.]